jgi:hypothetical protein
MPRRSKVLGMPQAVKDWLDDALVAGNFSGYEQLEKELKARGCDVGKSSIQRYGSEFEATIKRLKMTTEMARAVVQASPDDAGDMQEATVRLATQKLFTHMQNPELKDEDIAGFTKAIGELSRASVNLKKYREGMREKLGQKFAQLEGEAAKPKSGIDAATLARVRQEVYGLVG